MARARVRVLRDVADRVAGRRRRAGRLACGEAAIELGFGVRLRRAVVDEALELVGVGVELREVRVLAAPCRQGRVALLLQDHGVPDLRGDVAAQVPRRVGRVQELAAQRRRIARRDRDVVAQAALVGEHLEQARHASPGMRLERIRAGRADRVERRGQVVDVGGVVAQYRIDAAEGVAVADKKDLGRIGHRRRADGERGDEQQGAALHQDSLLARRAAGCRGRRVSRTSGACSTPVNAKDRAGASLPQRSPGSRSGRAIRCRTG